MDTKSLAKSKRAHTQHHSKKHHPKQTSKAPSSGSVGATSSQKQTGKQIREKPRQGSNALPTNWDRYEDEYDSDLENPSEGSTSHLTDVIVPKSKGADYGYLISEARSQAQTDYSTESFPSFDDVFTDFNLGAGSLLSVRGQSILSWIEDDNFVVEDNATGRQEASFLSMDLNALAEQLAKIDISHRLFIEADLLPPELYTEEIQADLEQESCKDEVTLKSEAAKKGSSELSDGAKQNDRNMEVTGTSAVNHPVKGELWESRRTDKSFIPESIDQFNVNSAAIQNKKPPRFEPADAEAELDMLLDSFSDPKILKSAVLKEEPSCISNTSQADASTSGLIGEVLVFAPMKKAHLNRH